MDSTGQSPEVLERNRLFLEIVQPELPVLLRVARSLTASSSEAEDLVQETLIKALSAISTFDGQYPRAWLLTIMRNTNMNLYRRKRPVLVDDFSFLESKQMAFGTGQSQSAEDEMAAQGFDHDLLQGLKSLEPAHREVLFLIDVEGLSYAECSTLLGVSVGAITSRLSRAREKMRKYLVESQKAEGQKR